MKRTYFPGITDIVVVTDPVEREELRRKIAAHTPNAGAHAIRDTRPSPPNRTESLLSRDV